MNEIRATRTIVVNNPQGLHARPAELFATLAMQFDATIEVVKDDQRADAKSILNILTLAVVAGTELKLEAVGSDAEAALDALVRLVEDDFTADGTMSQEQSS
jgi:phosphocarrier protein HPr